MAALRFSRLTIMLALLMIPLASAACRLPARQTSWNLSGSGRTWLPSLGERRAEDQTIRVWADTRSMWPLPLPASRPLFFGDADLFVLILLDNDATTDLVIDPARVALRETESGQAQKVPRVLDGCETVAPPGGRAACAVSLRVRRGTECFELDLSGAISAWEVPIVFGFCREGAWIWPRVGPSVPGLW